MPASPMTFYPSLGETWYIHKDYQAFARQMSEKMDIKFVPCLDLKMIEKLNSCSLLFHNFGDEVCEDKEFEKIARGGGYKKIHCIFVK